MGISRITNYVVNFGVEGDRQAMLDQLRRDIRDFKETRQLETVIVIWTANTERFSELRDGLNDTADNLLGAIRANHSEVAPSTLYAVASILEGVGLY